MPRAGRPPPHAVLAVSDKTGVGDLGAALDRAGWRIVATAGTADLLRGRGIDATTVSAFTGAPEMYGGRVKTFHPAIFGGILGWPEDEGAAEPVPGATVDTRIALVACNFYPLDPLLADEAGDAVLDSVDIGGPAMVAAAAKNYLRAVPLVSPGQYGGFIALLDAARGDPAEIPAEERRRYAHQAMGEVSAYYREVAALIG
jgi:phosphoribosylaminoimidazolecarboxamide formyltransferase/IMP cyclohydrolase